MPASSVGCIDDMLSYAAWASGSLDAVSAPPERNGSCSRRASAAMA